MNALRDAWKVFTGLVTLVLAMAVVAWLLNGVVRLAEVGIMLIGGY